MSDAYTEAQDFAEKVGVLNDLSHWLGEVLHAGRVDRALEIGGSGGLLAGLFASRHGNVICTDIVDWDMKYGGEGMKLLREKFARNGHALVTERLKYIPADAQNLMFRDDWFDIVFSLNAFEHISDPALALREAVRVTRPGGMLYLRFDPVWTADSGCHFLHRIGAPWAHLLLGDEDIAGLMRTNGADEDEIASYRQDMNRLPVNYYQNILPNLVAELGCSMVFFTPWSGTVDPDYVHHPNLAMAAARLNLDPDELLVRGFQFVIRKG
ncbi:class I SAM-dependent methyltransferase [Sandarakinorhabdus sp.]|uniref:class I SAM-dependent methyltransferase n=1 Tax=Sandarakinorhabdus sp. TaxID=1916663 RepID=UPI0033421A6D